LPFGPNFRRRPGDIAKRKRGLPARAGGGTARFKHIPRAGPLAFWRLGT